MPHGELEIVISGDPPLSTVATVLETAESIYERLYIITHSPGSSRGDFAARLKTPREFIPDEDRLRITVLERASLLMLLHGFLPVLTGLATVLGLLLAYSEFRRRLAEARKLTAETEKLRAETMQILQQITADGRALETSDVRAWMVFAVDTHQKLHGVGIDIDVTPISDYLKYQEEQLSDAPRRLGLSQAEIAGVVDDILQRLTRLKAVAITKIRLR